MIDWAKSLPVPAERVRGHLIKSLTPAWFEARRGRITASTRAFLLSRNQGLDWEHLRDELLADMSPDYERVDKDNDAMRWGRDHEREALDAVDAALGDLYEPGLILHPEYDFAGSTPDGFIGDHVTVQVKCPFFSRNHLKTLREQTISPEYYTQVQFESWTSCRPAIIFASYDPRQPRGARLVLINVPLDQRLQAGFEEKLKSFRRYLETGERPAVAKPIDSIPALF